jgi:Holliday junction resolvasome RuvABC endonuclease subunit
MVMVILNLKTALPADAADAAAVAIGHLLSTRRA